MRKLTHTLAAYSIDFVYVGSGNEEQGMDQLPEDSPHETIVRQLIKDLLDVSKKEDICSDSPYLLRLKNDATYEKQEQFLRISIAPNSGRRGEAFSVVNAADPSQKEVYFDENHSSIKSNNVFFYLFDNKTIALFHRFGGSGCKTIFEQMADVLLRRRGYHIKMNWLPPIGEDKNNRPYANVETIELIQTVPECPSTDIADNISKIRKTKTKKKQVAATLTLSLKYQSGSRFRQVLANDALSKVDMKNELISIGASQYGTTFDQIQVSVKMGRSCKKVSFEDIENLLDGFDITEEMAVEKPKQWDVLVACADKYALEIKGD